jgi:hypothetical protein
MFTVFRPDLEFNPLLLGLRAHDLPFHLESDKFLMVTNMKDADIIPLMHSDTEDDIQQKLNYIEEQGGIHRDQIILVMEHTHISNGFDFQQHIDKRLKVWKEISDYVYHVNVNSKDKINIFYDFHWNRQKAYFIDYDKYDLHDRLWTRGATQKMFEIDEITRHGPFKHFLVPTRVHKHRALENRNVVRGKIQEAISDEYCLRGNPEAGYVLEPQEINEHVLQNLANFNSPPWYPIASKYYAKTFVSIYAESVTVTGASESITEKTLDPMIKGHFVLPFGHRGLVRDIKKMGFLMPDWIDYGYDEIMDDTLRLQAFLMSIKELQQKSIEELHKLYLRDRFILVQNRNLFFTKPYDSLHDKIMERYVSDQKNIISKRVSDTINTLTT